MFSVFESSTVPYAGYPDAHLPRIEKPRRETSWTCGTVESELPFPLLSPEFHSTMQEFRVTKGKKIRHSVCRNDSGCTEAYRHGPEQAEHCEGILRGQCD
jgi:hypothetical protein